MFLLLVLVAASLAVSQEEKCNSTSAFQLLESKILDLCCREGKDGRDGRDGISIIGTPGRDGRDGKDGKDCVECARGPKGERGDVGATGPAGRDGQKGMPGERGEQGLQGEPGILMDVLAKNVTCWTLLAQSPDSPSGVYYLDLPSGLHRVYCEMAINGGGYTFLPGRTVQKMDQRDMAVLFTDSRDVLLRIAKADGTQPYTVISQLNDTGGLVVYLNSHLPSDSINNKAMGPYVYVHTSPIEPAVLDRQAGFMSNGKPITYTVCGGTHHSEHFAFLPNPKEMTPNDSHATVNVYEVGGVAVDWRGSAVNPHSGRRMPEEFFLFTEVYYAGCGCYTSSDRWINSKHPALGTAIGIK